MKFLNLGLIDYQLALDKQLEIVQSIIDARKISQSIPDLNLDTVIICSHPSIVTTGRQTTVDDVFGWKGPLLEISRGGRATYHGPSQVVIYPILDLKKPRSNRQPQEIRGYLRALEQAIVETFSLYNVKTVGRSLQTKSDSSTEQDETGVWYLNKKIANVSKIILNIRQK